MIAYGFHLSVRTKRIHLFADKGGKRAPNYVELATSPCSTHGIRVTFEELIPDVADVVLGTRVFGSSEAEVNSSTGGENTRSADTHSVHALIKGMDGPIG